MRLMKNAVYPEMRFEKAAVLAAALIGLPPATALRSLSPGKGMALLPSPSPKNPPCDFHRSRLKPFKRPLRRTRYSNRSCLRQQFLRAIAYDRSDASQPDWPFEMVPFFRTAVLLRI